MIRLLETNRAFLDREIVELKTFLLKVPYSHLETLRDIEKIPYSRGLADSSPFGSGGKIRLPSCFFHLDKEQREFTFLHEMGHTYFDFKDFYEGKRARLRFGACKKEDVAHLLRVQWMELGWELNPENWEIVKREYPADEVNRDKYIYMVKYGNPNHEMGEWKCSTESKISKDLSQFGFAYNELYYSPKEEMADAYALFIMDRKKFKNQIKKGKIIKAKYEFIEKCFEDDSKGQIEMER